MNLQLALRFAGCVLSLDADQLRTWWIKHPNAPQHTGIHREGFLGDCKFLPFPASHICKITMAFTALNILLPWADSHSVRVAYLGLRVQTAIFPHHNYHGSSTEASGDMKSVSSEVCLAVTPLWTLQLVQGGGGALEVTKPPMAWKERNFFLIITKNLAGIQNKAIWNVQICCSPWKVKQRWANP